VTFDTKLESLLPKRSKKAREGVADARLILVTSQEIDELCEQDDISQARGQMDGEVERGKDLQAAGAEDCRFIMCIWPKTWLRGRKHKARSVGVERSLKAIWWKSRSFRVLCLVRMMSFGKVGVDRMTRMRHFERRRFR
jgi:hypothetical protein